MVGGSPAIVSAVVAALAPRGVRHLDLPIAAAHVWTLLQDRGQQADT